MQSNHGHQEAMYQPADSRDPFSPPAAAPTRRYYDHEPNAAEGYPANRRDTFASDSSADGADGERYFDQHGQYDPYGACRRDMQISASDSFFLSVQVHP